MYKLNFFFNPQNVDSIQRDNKARNSFVSRENFEENKQIGGIEDSYFIYIDTYIKKKNTYIICIIYVCLFFWFFFLNQTQTRHRQNAGNTCNKNITKSNNETFGIRF